jgi:DNA-binding GntR family transcriptional regulator
LKRSNASDAAAEAVRAMLVGGVLPEGERINEVRLAGALGVSRTPLREALNRLAAEGALTHTPNLGFAAMPLSADEFEPLYAMRAILDPAALRLAGLPSPSRLRRLIELNAQILASGPVERMLDLDDQWHLELIAGCTNPILIDLIGQFMRRTRRYEIALMRAPDEALTAVGEHGAVLDALQAGDMDGACEALRDNLTRGAEPMLRWLKARRTQGGVQ